MTARSAPEARSYNAMFRGRRALVLGATGFIGRRVVRALAGADAVVTASGRDIAGLNALRTAYGVRAIPCDLARDADLRELVFSARPEVTFNLTGYGVSRAEHDPDVAQLINTELPQRLVRGLTMLETDTWPGQRLIHAGSALEYGDVGGSLAEDGPAEPATLYGRTKLAGTRALAAESRATGLSAVTARLFTVYGPGERSGRLLPTLIQSARSGAAVQLTAGNQRRDFVYVDDTAEALMRLAACRDVHHDTVNVATGVLITVREFVERAASVLGLVPAQLLFGRVATRSDEITHDPVSNARLRETTGWTPTVSIELGVQRTIDDAQRLAISR